MIYISQALTYNQAMRNTLQTSVVKGELAKLGHATNRELWIAVEKRIPGITLTSIHRITQRLRSDGAISCTPNLNGDGIVDANPLPHAHFMCRLCGRLVDIELDDAVIRAIQSQLTQGIIEKSLFIAGKCQPCVAVVES